MGFCAEPVVRIHGHVCDLQEWLSSSQRGRNWSIQRVPSTWTRAHRLQPSLAHVVKVSSFCLTFLLDSCLNWLSESSRPSCLLHLCMHLRSSDPNQSRHLSLLRASWHPVETICSCSFSSSLLKQCIPTPACLENSMDLAFVSWSGLCGCGFSFVWCEWTIHSHSSDSSWSRRWGVVWQGFLLLSHYWITKWWTQ